MKIKSLLLGSAAALVAVTGARAADAIIVEAEPMEYVKVCDMYGAGYFYIPGTETCLKFGGALRVLYGVNHDHEDGEVSDHDTNVRLRFNIDAKNETEYGTLTSSARVSWSATPFGDAPGLHDVYSANETNSAGAGLDYALISLAGFTIGYGDSRLSEVGGSWGGKFSNKATFFDYTYSAGDLSLTVGIQDHAASGAAGQPDVYAVANYAGEGFSAAGWAVLDTSSDGVAYGAAATMDLSSFIPGGSIRAFWEGDDYDHAAAADCAYGSATATAALCGGTDYVKGHLWGVRMDYKLTDSLKGFTRYAEHSDGGDRIRTELVWSIASGLALAGRYDKINGATGRYELELTRSF